jgi:ribosomal-protein-serine acetyltransferase
VIDLRLPAEIRTERLVLRPLAESDIDAIIEATLESVATVGPWMSWAHEKYNREEATAWINTSRGNRERGDAAEYGVFDHAGRFLGGCGLNTLNRLHRMANLGYWIRASAEGRGYASEAARTLARLGLENGLVRVEIVADVDNIGSQRVAEKAGGVREAVLRNRIGTKEPPRDAVMFSVVRS